VIVYFACWSLEGRNHWTPAAYIFKIGMVFCFQNCSDQL
jgi:hypothetical protein